MMTEKKMTKEDFEEMVHILLSANSDMRKERDEALDELDRIEDLYLQVTQANAGGDK